MEIHKEESDRYAECLSVENLGKNRWLVQEGDAEKGIRETLFEIDRNREHYKVKTLTLTDSKNHSYQEVKMLLHHNIF